MYKTAEALYELQDKIQAQKNELEAEIKSFVDEESKDYRVHRILYTHTLVTYNIIHQLIDLVIGIIKGK